MKQRKKIIWDTCEDTDIVAQTKKVRKNQSHSAKKAIKQKIPILKINLDEKRKRIEGEDQAKKSIKKKTERSLSRSSKGTVNNSEKNKLLKYVCSRIDSGAKGWKTIKNIFKDKPKGV